MNKSTEISLRHTVQVSDVHNKLIFYSSYLFLHEKCSIKFAVLSDFSKKLMPRMLYQQMFFNLVFSYLTLFQSLIEQFVGRNVFDCFQFRFNLLWLSIQIDLFPEYWTYSGEVCDTVTVSRTCFCADKILFLYGTNISNFLQSLTNWQRFLFYF